MAAADEKPLLFATPADEGLDGLISCLRAAVGIARALDYSLVLPHIALDGQWFCVHSFINVEAIASIVSLASEADAIARLMRSLS